MLVSRTSARLRLRGLAAAAVLVGSLTACGSGGSSGTTADSAPTTSSSSSASSDTSSSSAPSDTASTIDDGAEVSVADFVKKLQQAVEKTHYAHMEFAMAGSGTNITGQGDSDYTSTPPSTTMTMSLGAQSMRILTVGHLVYLDSGQTGGKYLKYDLNDPNSPLGSGLTAQLDPASQMESFSKAVTSVSSLGSKTVEGRKLDAYRMVIDSTKLANQGTATSSLPPQITSDVYFDSEGRLAKISMALGAIQYDAMLTDFDKPVHITAPPASQVAQQPAS